MISSSGSLRSKLFLAFALITLIATVFPAVLVRNALYSDRMELAGKQALAQASFARSILETSPTPSQTDKLFQTAKALSYRMTLTDAQGMVLRDTHIDAPKLAELDNHGDRPEIEQAIADGQGIALRHSTSLGLDAVYAAVALEDGRILRMAVPAADVRYSLETKLSYLGMIVVGVALFCLLLSALITAQVKNTANTMAEVVASIAREKSFRRLREVPGKEFLPLAYAVNSMADSIEAYVQTTRDQHGQLESILEAMHEGVLVLNPAGGIRRWNKALEALFPVISGAKDKPVIEGIPVPALQTRVDTLLKNRDQGSLQAERVQFELPPGRFLVAHLTRPLHSKESLGVIIVIYDATELMRLDVMRRDFISNVSHELRTPLTAVRGYAEVLMLHKELPEEQRGFASIIHNHAASLSRLVSDLLILSRVENAREVIEVAPVSMETVFEDALAHCQDRAKSKNIRFDARFDSTPVSANCSLLTQVFRNLLENACRYAPENSAVVVAGEKDGATMRFVVADNGPGIPKEALSRIFERFYQVKEERNSGTSGVGLAICKHIVERHGGKIWAESPHGSAGTAIFFTLPLVK